MQWQKHQENSKWYNHDQYIDNWLKERQELLGILSRLLQLEPFSDENQNFDTDLLKELCEVLVDYVSAGHFEIFEKLADAKENSNDIQAMLDKELMEEILLTTQFFLNFSTLYASENYRPEAANFDLSKLSEQIAKRMDLEDRLIKKYLQGTFSISELKNAEQQ